MGWIKVTDFVLFMISFVIIIMIDRRSTLRRGTKKIKKIYTKINQNKKRNLSSLDITKSFARSVRMLSQRQMISNLIRSSILIMRMEISVRYPIRPPKMEFRHCLIFMMRTDGCRRSKENCIPRGRQQRKSSEVIPMIRLEDWSNSDNRL